VLATLGPIGATMIAVALATTDGPGDGALLYIWPILWEAYFFGRRGAVAIVAWVGLVQGIALLELPAGDGYFDRWLDVMVSIGVVAVVIDLFSSRILTLLGRLDGEARVDNLTGLLNRRGFAERAEVELARARRHRSALGLVSFDLDHFKAVNDEFGHDVGDEVLVLAARLIGAETRPEDVVARMGGEEFVALLPDGGLGEAESLAERVRGSLARSSRPGLPRVTICAGVSAVIAPDDVELLLKAADRALYAAKRGGRNRTGVGERSAGRDLLRAV
jgi:diguanylate cyclase (GGDEF)-like protein